MEKEHEVCVDRPAPSGSTRKIEEARDRIASEQRKTGDGVLSWEELE